MRKIRTFLAGLILVAFFTTTIFSQYIAARPEDGTSGANDPKAREIIVKYKNQSKSEAVKANAKKKAKLSRLKLKRKLKSTRVEVLEIGQKDDMGAVLKELNSSPEVAYAQPNYKLTTGAFPSDTYFNEQWGLYNNGQTVGGQAGLEGVDVNALQAWTLTQGSQSVVVGVMDTGIDINHPDLHSSIFVNPAEIAGNGVDDDGNGFIDDVNGWDFLNDDKTVYDSGAADVHGTHVAGIIAASADSQGIAGVAPKVRIMPLKFINDETGYTSDAIEAIEYAKLMGVKIVNCSWSGYDYNAALLDAMQNTDILFVCAAGNNGRNSSSMPNYPAGFDIPNVISVAALDNKGKLASFSNFGSNVQVAAPGVNILSTLPENSYGYMSGTSMAAPHVTGIAALLKSYRQEMLFVDIAARIKANAVPIQTLEGKVSSGGRADAYAALNNSVLNYSNEAEPNNNWENATAIMAGKTNGSIAAIDDVDWFKLSLQEGKPVSIKLKGIPAGNDFDLELYAPDMSRADCSYNTKNSQETVGIVPEQSGTYYIRVKPHTFSGAGEQPYVLDMDLYNSIPGGNEPNDTKDTPTGILENKTYYSTIDYPGDVDWYAIEATRAGKLVTGLGQIPEGADYNVEIYAPNGDKLGGSYFGGNKEEKIDIMVNATGRYLIKVYSEQHTTPEATYGIELKDTGTEYSVNRQLNPGASSIQPYELTTRLVAPDSYEENDSYRTARQISPTDTVSATIDNQKDEDWYRVDVSLLTSMYLKLSSIAAGLDYDLTLLDSRLDYVAGSFKRGSLSEDAFTELEPGTYYIKVDSYAGYSDKNAYKLILSPYKLDEYEINDTPEAARELAINRSINATIHNITDQDWYRFTFQQAGKLDIQLSNIPEGCNYELELYNSANEKIDESKQAAGSDEVIWRDVPEGEYYIKVYTTGGFDCENGYMLTVNRNIGLANALNISENSTSTGKIAQDSGSNWYKTSVTQAGVFTLSLDNIPESCYYKLELYDAEGYKLIRSNNVSATQQSIDLVVDEPSDYYINVYSVFGSSESQAYTLTAKLTPVADLEVPEKVAEGVDLGEDAGDGEAQANGAASGGKAAGLAARLPQEITQRADFSPDSMGTSTAEGFKVSLDEARLPEKRSTVKTEGFTGLYAQETERNDLTINVDGKDEATHQLKQLNTIVSGSLQSTDTNDYYLFSNNQRGKYIIEIDNSPTGGNLKLYFTGVNWGGQYYLSDGVNHDAYVAALVTDPAPQYYVIRVIGSGITSGSVAYKLKVTFMPEDFVNSHDPGEMGNNDSFSGARYISRATSGDNINYTAQEATLDFRNDYDAYRISLDSGHKFTAILKSPLEHGNYYYVLLDSSYKEVQDNLYNGQDQTGAACYELMYNVPLTGTYYLLVFSDENKYYDVFNKYKLEFYSSKNNEAMEYNSSVKNFNNAWEFASSISLNTAYTCKLDSPFDCDVYSISIPSEGKLTVNLDKKDFGDNYSLMVKDLDSTIYEYINSKTDYVFYAQRSGTYKLAVIRRNLQSPSSLDYALAAAFTPKSGFDTYENTSTVTPVKNVDFLKSNNQYLKVNGSITNLTSLTSTARTITMDNPYDVDWFKIDTTIAAANKYCGTITLTGVPSGDEYSLVAVDANGNVKGSGKKQLGINLGRSSNRYIYVAVYATKYTASNHSASISVGFNNDGLVSNLGLDPKAAIEGYTYDDLLNEQPLLQVSAAGGSGSSGKKVKSLQGVYAALGFSFDTGVIGYYDSAQTFCATRALMAHFGMDWKITKDSDIGSLTWPKLIGLIDQFGIYSATQKAYWRDYFKNEQQRQIDQYMGWELELKLDASASSSGKISMSASCGSAKQITLSLEKNGKTIWTSSKAGASISGESVQPDGTYVVKATAEGKANGKTYTSSMQKTVYVSTPKASSITVAGTGTSSITLNITNPSGKTLKVYKNSNGSLTELRSISLSAGSTTLTVGDLYSGQKYRFKVFGQNEEDYVDAETQGTGYDGTTEDLMNSINEEIQKQADSVKNNNNSIFTPSISDVTSLLSAVYNNENYEYVLGKKTYRSFPGGIIKEYEKDINGVERLIRQYKPSNITTGQRFTSAFNNVKRLNFIKGLSGALAVAGCAVDVINQSIEREESTGRPLTNREWAAVIITSIGLNVASTILSGIIGSTVAALIAPEAPVANIIIGGLVGCGVGYLCTIFMNEIDLQNRLENQLINIFGQLFPGT